MPGLRCLLSVIAVFIFSVQLSCEGLSTFGKEKYIGRKSRTRTKLHVPRRSGILETIQAIPTDVTPLVPSSAGNASLVNETETMAEKTLNTRNSSVFLNTTFSLVPVNETKAKTAEERNGSNTLQNLKSFTLDQPNSFLQPTSIPFIDTLADATPTPVGSINSEMEDVEKTPTVEPMADELSSEETMQGIPNMPNLGQMPVQEEDAWERSRSAGKQSVSATKKDELKHDEESRERTALYAKRCQNVAGQQKRLARKGKIYNSKKGRLNMKQKRTHPSGELKIGGNRAKIANKFIYTKTLGGRSRVDSADPRKKVSIPPPTHINPIDPLLEKFEREKDVSNIEEHTIDIKTASPNELIDKHLLHLKAHPKIESISGKHKLSAIQPIGEVTAQDSTQIPHTN